jgi:hypothetical protein
MKLPRRNFLHLAAGAAALPALPRVAGAEAYPARTVTIIVPVAAERQLWNIGKVTRLWCLRRRAAPAMTTKRGAARCAALGRRLAATTRRALGEGPRAARK